MYRNLAKFGRVFLKWAREKTGSHGDIHTYRQTDTQTYTQTDMLITILRTQGEENIGDFPPSVSCVGRTRWRPPNNPNSRIAYSTFTLKRPVGAGISEGGGDHRKIFCLYMSFLPREAMLSAVYAVVVCLSVCLCVCHTPVLYQNG